MRYVSLFAGAGGLDYGLHLACPEAEPLLVTDIDFNCVNTLNAVHLGHMNGDNVVCADIQQLLDTGLLAGFAGDVDVVIGGPPCQPFSVAGKQDPNDPRAQLVHRFMDAVEVMRPKAFLMENVEALTQAAHTRTFTELMQRGNAMGYRMYAEVINAAFYGVPQQRKRAFLFGMPPGRSPRVPRPQYPLTTARQAIDGVDHDGDVFPSSGITLARKPVLRPSPYAGMLLNGGGRVIDLDSPSPTITASIGGNRTHVIDLDQLETFARPWIEGYHDLLWNFDGKPLPFVPSNKANRMRRLSMRECAVLQGFPQYYPFQGSNASKWRQIGNAVPPPLARAAVTALLDGYRAH